MHPNINKQKITKEINKVIDFGHQLFASILRSRTGSLSELSTLLRFETGTKGFERMYEKLLPLINEIKEAFKKVVLEKFPLDGLRLAIFNDTAFKIRASCSFQEVDAIQKWILKIKNYSLKRRTI